MSVTSTSKIDEVLEWLENNTFWNSDLVEVRPSEIGGLGVFWKPGQHTDNDNLLLRVPKSAILSPKNSFIFPMLMDYEPQDESVDFSGGMHAIVLTFIYEQAMGEKSPWHSYLDSFDVTSETSVPLCLWLDQEKAALFNSEADLLNMLDLAELIAFFLECVRFGETNAKFVATPPVLQIEAGADSETVKSQFMDNLELFGRYVQAVISRAFTVDKYLGLSLVPGADLFNHLSPVFSDGEVVERANVHFVCDDDDDLCGECGEIGCAHLDSDEEEENEEEEEGEEEEEEEGEEEIEEEEEFVEELMEETENLEDEMDLMESDVELEESSELSDSDSLEDESEEENEEESVDDEPVPEKTVLTMEDVLEVEMSEAETEQDDEEVSTLSLSEDEQGKTHESDESSSETSENSENSISEGGAAELVAELSDSSKCCDIVLTAPPTKENNYELFNTYGDDLGNPYLLQRYGLVSALNPNTSCLLSVQMFSYLKKEKLHKKRRLQLKAKLAWYEDIGFDLVNDLCVAAASQDHDHDEEHEQHEEEEHEHEEDHGNEENHEHHEHDNDHDHDHDHCGDSCTLGCCDDSEVECPESWQLSPKIRFDGTPTDQTIALVRLFLLPFKIFHYKVAGALSERKLVKRVAHYLLNADVSEEEKTLLRAWVEARLARYREISVAGERGEMARLMILQEKEVLGRALAMLA